jgi:hypothetical protein
VGELDGKVAVVTGGSLGIGRATVQRLATDGAAVVLCGHDDASVQDALAELRDAGLEVDGRRADVRSSAEVEGLVRLAVERYGGVDILVNSAGIQRYGTVVDTSEELWDEVLGVNLKGMFLTAKHCVPELRRRGGGSIVNVASVMGLRSIGQIPDAAYVASKAGLIGLTRELASQWGRFGIRVNAVAPGFFASEMTAGLGDDPDAFPPFLVERTPLGRGGRTGELDEAVLFLLGRGSSFVTGHVLSVDGGLAVR